MSSYDPVSPADPIDPTDPTHVTSPSLVDLGWEPARSDDLPPGLRPARVVRVDRGSWTVLTGEPGGPPLRAALTTDLRQRADDPTDPVSAPGVGDWVGVRAHGSDDVVAAVLPRRTAVTRASSDATATVQVLAANVDLAAVVVGLDQVPSTAKVERLVSFAWESGAQPLVLLTKADLAPDADDVRADVEAVAPGVEVLCLSTLDGRGLDALRAAVDGGTLALIGSSGAGKSSLVNALAGREVLATEAIRDDGRGRHTSVRRELVVVPGVGCVIDTPGIRGAGLAGGSEGVAATFEDVEQLVRACRFADCGHAGEPGCAVAAALADGTLPVRRWESWGKLQRELAWVRRRTDGRLRAEESRLWKQRSKDSRAHRKQR